MRSGGVVLGKKETIKIFGVVLVALILLSYRLNFHVVSNIKMAFLVDENFYNRSAHCSSNDSDCYNDDPALSERPLPPVHINSTWVGNQWMPPPGYRLYETRELQDYFRQHSILFIGDSTARRQYATMYAILTGNADNLLVEELDSSKVLDVNKKNKGEEVCSKEGIDLCRNYFLKKLFDLKSEACLDGILKEEIQNPDFWSVSANYSLIIFVLGPWEIDNKVECGAGRLGRKTQTKQIFQSLFDSTSIGTIKTEFIWRTWGSPGRRDGRDHENLWNLAVSHNNYVKYLVDINEMEQKNRNQSMSMVSYVDWGQAMLPRLFPPTRIVGDIPPHYGLEARLMFVQMLTNHLVERERQKNQHIPRIAYDSIKRVEEEIESTDYLIYIKCISSAKPEEVIPDDKMQMYKDALSEFCETCRIEDNSNVLCEQKRSYLCTKWKRPYWDALIETLEKHQTCNKSAVIN